MNYSLIVFACVLLASRCCSYPVEDSVVSVYTTQSTTAGTNPPLDVYHQIASNIADRITSPIYRFLGYNRTSTDPAPETTVHQREVEDDNVFAIKPVDNDIGKARDVEELSPDRIKPQKKPEKITLYSSLAATYLPSNLEDNNTRSNEVDIDTFDLDDVELGDTPKPREGPFIFFLEFIGSIFQLVWGGLTSLFRPSSSS